jgi:hypothetical protein
VQEEELKLHDVKQRMDSEQEIIKQVNLQLQANTHLGAACQTATQAVAEVSSQIDAMAHSISAQHLLLKDVQVLLIYAARAPEHHVHAGGSPGYSSMTTPVPFSLPIN